MSLFVDTSALYALLDPSDADHGRAAGVFDDNPATAMSTHSYVLVETTALVQRRLGMEAARGLHDALVPRLGVRWVDEALHRAAVTALLAAGRRRVSLVDWVSFAMMRTEGITTAFAFDDDFAQQGFTTVP
ncbi:MAG: type II toxin-antitoxin system VapC family toxin [Egibacteraceae bacterium]